MTPITAEKAPRAPEEAAEISVAKTLDCQGELCPMPVYKASMAMAGLAPGGVLELLATDPGARADVPAFARQGGHDLLSAERVDGVERFLIRKGGGRQRRGPA